MHCRNSNEERQMFSVCGTVLCISFSEGPPCPCSSSAFWSPASHVPSWKARKKLQHCDENEGAGRSTAKRQGGNVMSAGNLGLKWHPRTITSVFLSSYCHHSPRHGSLRNLETTRLLNHSCGAWHFQHHRTQW